MSRIKEFLKKHKKIILILLAIILIIIVGFFSISKPKETVKTTSSILGSKLAEQPTIIKGSLTKEDKESSSASIIAKTFTEIYGSYSNQSNYSNTESVLPLLSASYKVEMSAFLKKSRATYIPASIYNGVTTVVINTKVESLNETSGLATILLKTQRKESTGTQANYTIKYQDIRLKLVKESDKWLIDSASWQ